MKYLKFESYISTIKNSSGAKTFRNAYFEENGKKTDVLKNGKLSCAFFVSSVLKIFGLVSGVHATVKGTIRDMESNGWEKVSKPKPGCVIEWEEKNGHEHVGFYLGGNKAISNSTEKRVPMIHHWTYGNKRKVIAIYWNGKLNNLID